MGCHCSSPYKKHSNVDHDNVVRPARAQAGLDANVNRNSYDQVYKSSTLSSPISHPSSNIQQTAVPALANGNNVLKTENVLAPEEYQAFMTDKSKHLKELRADYLQSRNQRILEAIRSELLMIVNTRPLISSSSDVKEHQNQLEAAKEHSKKANSVLEKNKVGA